MPRRHGKNGQVWMDPTGASTYVLVADVSGFTLDATSENVPVTAFGNTNIVYVKGLANYQGDLKSWWSADNVVFFDAAFAGTPVGLKLVPSSLDTVPAATFFSGQAYVDAGVDCPADGAVAVTGSWVAAGNWLLTP